MTWDTDLELPVSDTFCLYSVRELMETNFRGETSRHLKDGLLRQPSQIHEPLYIAARILAIAETKSQFWSYSFEAVTSVFFRISHNGLTLQQSNRYGATPLQPEPVS
jgi:hypothetical protein